MGRVTAVLLVIAIGLGYVAVNLYTTPAQPAAPATTGPIPCPPHFSAAVAAALGCIHQP